MPQSVTTKVRRSVPARAATSSPPRRSIWFRLAVIVAAAVIGVLVTDLVDPGRRVGATPGGMYDFAASFGIFLLLFATGFAILSTIFDVMTAWARSTPESERRRGDGGDGGFFDLFGGDGDGGDGGGD